jgi:mRNA interferase MazF
MARGDILTVEFPSSSGLAGHEQVGYRPAIVVQTDTTNSKLPTTMIVPFTANLSAARFPHTLQVDPSPENGLSKTSVLLVFQLRAIDKGRLGKNIGRLEQHHVQRLEAEMRLLLGL